ncbi:L-alanine exporter AlaE, partial [Mycobacterium tuberculosis]|nr:L-alanine exporter AlaE [Mycobacterium tuberculosis]
VAILCSLGAAWHKIGAALSSNLAVSMMMGAAYGYFLDYCRRLFRVAPYQQAKA